MPDIETQLYQKYKDQGLKVIALDASVNDIPYPAQVAEYIDYLGPTYPAGIESLTFTYTAFASYYEGSNPFPIDIIIDRQGNIQYIAREYDMATMEAIIVDLLK